MTKNELLLAAQFLEDYCDRLGNDGCNDYDLPNTDENWDMLVKIEEEIDPKETTERPPKKEPLQTVNFSVAGYIARRLKAEANK
jgi:hypothetical protein